ncbi:MAG: hypothetical protein LBT73_01925 [Tannerellaceae bacterium]|jgi:hypothetical protein|nr:hypothetical protein [Tannerellaceae bacterium]
MKEALTFAFFVVLALGFWYVQSLSDTPLLVQETEIEAAAELTEKALQIEIKTHGIPPGYKVRWFPPVVKVVCRLPAGRYRDLETTDVEILASFKELQNNLSGIMHVKAEAPSWVSAVDVNPNRVEFLIEEP